MSEYGARLFDHHQQLLRDSAINPDVRAMHAATEAVGR